MLFLQNGVNRRLIRKTRIFLQANDYCACCRGTIHLGTQVLSLFSRPKILLLVKTAAAPLHGHGPEGPRDDPHTSENTVSTEDNRSVCLLNTPAVEFPVMIV